MKVLQINNVYGRLSTGKIVADLHHEYQNVGIESYVCYGRGPVVHDKNVKKICWESYAKLNKIRAMISGIMYAGCSLSTHKLICEIKKIQPDVIHLQCINDYFVNIYRLLEYLGEKKIPTVVTLHAEFMHTGTCGHAYACEKWKKGCYNCENIKQMRLLKDSTNAAWKKMREAFAHFDVDKIVITSVSPWLESRSFQSDITNHYRHVTVLNGLDTSLFRYADASSLKLQMGSEGKKIVLFVTSSLESAAKGGGYLVDIAKQLVNKGIVFLILGDGGKREDLPQNIIKLGRVYEQEKVARYYSMADATILCSQAETFSMPTAESLCCGTPVVGFKAGGPETIGIEPYCQFVEYGNVDALKQALIAVLDANFDRSTISQLAREKYSKEAMAEKYMKIYRMVVADKETK